MIKSYISDSAMQDLLEKSDPLSPPTPCVLVDGVVVFVEKNKVLVDLDGIATGIISGQEAHDSTGTIKDIKIGDTVSAYVLEEENEDGLVVLSLRKASQEKTWTGFVDAHDTEKTIEVVPNEANKGGLLLNVDGIKGFIPVSQLAPLHYPRVDGADSNMILTRLQKLIGVTLRVRIINIDSDGGKLILSEKAAEQEVRTAALDELDIGTKVKGRVSGVVKFGIFVTFGGLEGLVHISEIAWGHVKDPNDYGKVGDEIEVMVIGKERDKISLSTKRLHADPWVEATKNYKVGTKVKGEITRVTPFGAFVKLEADINGLIHISELSGEEGSDPADFFKVGDKVDAHVINIDPEEHRVGLSVKTDSPKAEKEEKPKKAKAKEEEEVVVEKAEAAEEAPEKAAEEAPEETVKEEIEEEKEA